MKFQELFENGAAFQVENAEIHDVSLSFKEHGVLTLNIYLKGEGWGCCFGGYVLGKGYLGANEFKGNAAGIEALMQIMNVVGVEDLFEMNGRCIRIVTTGGGGQIKAIGNLITDKWFSYEKFFEEVKNRDGKSGKPEN